ncbi:hexosaminidase [Mariniphaga anaerophila]|uniref:beta-N-acetylhexosaminidase n=1 Tax=Mariniphaga anaerophila TaxID=1484053 RepID=A0A1M4VDN4_9BACT|nr:beta-N-acetylhexosaminidase [Mariniphaga anaerophila]SHE66983.1 hexosaminidase [Mariniphaga anaerophila]
MKTLFFLLFSIFAFLSVSAVNIIPYPSKVSESSGKVVLKKKLVVSYSDDLTAEGIYLSRVLENDFAITTKNNKKRAVVLLKKNPSLLTRLGEEGYLLDAKNNKVVIQAATGRGVFYGIQTLRQIIEKGSGSTCFVNGVEIEDSPRFSWRAFMLDESRNFKGMKVVKELLDEMALLKLNTFHWHLTDDQGWRIEIEKYPLLTQIGARRDSTQSGVWPGGWSSTVYDTTPHEGFYTKQQIREILKYAKERHIQVIPEIEMPGHACAAIASYPWLGVSKKKISVPAKFGVHYDVFDFTDSRVENFLKDVLDEIFELFPAPIVHIGGDEVRHDQWESSPEINKFMQENGIESYSDLQVWFTNRMSKYIESKGHRMMGWNDIMGVQLHEYNKEEQVKEKLAQSAIVHFWKGDLDLVKQAVSAGHEIVNSYHEFTYLDYDYERIPLEKAYSFNPVPEGLPAGLNNKILGLGCQMWGEWIPTKESMEQRVFPRIAAYAEVGWTSTEQKDYTRFTEALPFFINRWKKAGINYNQDAE